MYLNIKQVVEKKSEVLNLFIYKCQSLKKNLKPQLSKGTVILVTPTEMLKAYNKDCMCNLWAREIIFCMNLSDNFLPLRKREDNIQKRECLRQGTVAPLEMNNTPEEIFIGTVA
jgi:hypothetical protein